MLLGRKVTTHSVKKENLQDKLLTLFRIRMLDETLWRVKSKGFLHVNLDWFIVFPKLGHTFSREQPEFQDFVPKTYCIYLVAYSQRFSYSEWPGVRFPAGCVWQTQVCRWCHLEVDQVVRKVAVLLVAVYSPNGKHKWWFLLELRSEKYESRSF